MMLHAPPCVYRLCLHRSTVCVYPKCYGDSAIPTTRDVRTTRMNSSCEFELSRFGRTVGERDLVLPPTLDVSVIRIERYPDGQDL